MIKFKIKKISKKQQNVVNFTRQILFWMCFLQASKTTIDIMDKLKENGTIQTQIVIGMIWLMFLALCLKRK